MTVYLPRFQPQGPADNCVISGKLLGWLSCSAYAAAMLVDRSTSGGRRPSGCDVRRLTGDTVGGLNLDQMETAMERYGIAIERRTGSNFATPLYLKTQLRAGRSAIIQVSTGPLIGTPFQSTNGRINHCVELNDIDSSNRVRVYDPAADGRRSTFDTAPSWWSWSLVERTAAALQPWGEGDSRTLGAGRMYVAIGPDNEPAITYRWRGRALSPQPDRLLGNAGAGRYSTLRNSPRRRDTHGNDTTVGRLGHDASWYAWQVTTAGESIGGNSKWYGDRLGRVWVHSSGIRGVG